MQLKCFLALVDDVLVASIIFAASIAGKVETYTGVLYMVT